MFHNSSFQLKLKKGTVFPAPHIEQIVLKLVESPKLFPVKTRNSITSPIRNPDTGQGQGDDKNSAIMFFNKFTEYFNAEGFPRFLLRYWHFSPIQWILPVFCNIIPMIVAIIGGGVSGALTAINLLTKTNFKVKLVEKAQVCEGVAYSTKQACHYLNVPVGKMSIFSDVPDHFYQWLHNNDFQYDKKDFVSRQIYSKYFSDVFDKVAAPHIETGRLELVQDEVEDLILKKDGVEICLKSESSFFCNKVVLALGNLSPANIPLTDMEYTTSPYYIQNPWNKLELDITSEGILLIGTGLTMVDMVMSLHKAGYKGKITALSRHGLLPFTHNLNQTYPDYSQEIMDLNSLSKIFRVIKKHFRLADKRGISRFAVIDSLRPYTQKLWLGLSYNDKKQFLRHIKHYWDVLRHRIPKESSGVINEMLTSGQLKIVSGRLKSSKDKGLFLEVRYDDRESGKVKSENFNQVINCTGPNFNFEKQKQTLIKNLVEKGIICNAPVGFGINALPQGNLINKEGKPSEIFFTLGPPLKGILWESTAVPEIRVQAEKLVDFLKQNFEEKLQKVAG
jgi:uncharacterized NAD(P)/FAD-binding protein YdhS